MLNNREYYTRLLKLAIPSVLANLMANSVGMATQVMVGQLGDAAVASSGLANQVSLLFFFVLFGVCSGSSIFTAQLWGKKDVVNLRKVQGLGLIITFSASVLFFIAGIFFSRAAIGIYSSDPEVIEKGGLFLQIIAPGFLFMGISFVYSAVLRSTGNVKIPMATGVFSMVLGVAISYCLIFGKFGFPHMGLNGAAVGTVIWRVVDCLLLVPIIYIQKLPNAGRLSEMFKFDIGFTRRVLKTSAPVIINEIFWSIGTSAYSLIYARISTEAYAAVSIAKNVEALSFVLIFGMSEACGIMVGNTIGAGDPEKAYKIARRSLIIVTGLAILLGGGVILWAGDVMSWFKVSSEVNLLGRTVIMLVGIFMVVRSSNVILMVGIIRAGGDTNFVAIVEIITLWGLGIPAGLCAAFIFHLPLLWVFVFTMADELTKYGVGLYWFIRKRWIKNLTRQLEVPVI
jgi:putative MATE family efflux protein